MKIESYVKAGLWGSIGVGAGLIFVNAISWLYKKVR